jgi:hypothetical protein
MYELLSPKIFLPVGLNISRVFFKELCANPRKVSTSRRRGMVLCCLQKTLTIIKVLCCLHNSSAIIKVELKKKIAGGPYPNLGLSTNTTSRPF